jgi:(S)-citramalyl-CoA lyase
MQESIRALKSWLFTPGNKADRFSRAAEIHADALIIDLEDAVAPSAKQEARDAAIKYLGELPRKHLPCALRVNSPTTKVGVDDLHALLSSSATPDYVVLPKCNSSALVDLIHGLLLEAHKSTEVIALIETAKAVEGLEGILRGETKPAGLLFGAADMAADLGAETAWEPLLWVRSRVIQAAAAAGVPVLDSPYFDITNLEGLKQETKASASLGFMGKCAIHPKQIATINEVFTPSAEEVAKARDILRVNQQGVGSVDHQMVDEAVARKARLVLQRARAAVQ